MSKMLFMGLLSPAAGDGPSQDKTHLPETGDGFIVIRERSYPTEATSGARQAHHQVCTVREVIDRFIRAARYAGLDDPSRPPKRQPPTRFMAAMTCSTSGGLTGG
jgi:hypothetical protein